MERNNKYFCINVCCIITILAILFLLTLDISITAYASEGFLTKPYRVAEFDFDSSSNGGELIIDNYVTESDIFGRSGNALVLNNAESKKAVYIPSQSGLYGKTQITFKIAQLINSGVTSCIVYGSECDFSKCNEPILRVEFIPKESDKNQIEVYAVYSNDKSEFLAETNVELWNTAELQLDTVNRKCDIRIGAQSNILSYCHDRQLVTENLTNYCISKVEFTSAGKAYLDDVIIERSDIFSTGTPVITHTNGVYSMGKRIENNSSEDKSYVAIIAKYCGERLVSASVYDKIFVPANESKVVEFFTSDSEVFFDMVKSFVWENTTYKPDGINTSNYVSGNGDLRSQVIFDSGMEGKSASSGGLLSGRSAPENWKFFDWAKPAAPCVDASVELSEVFKGNQAVYICATDSKQAGWISKQLEVPPDGISIAYAIKESEDYQVASPSVFATFYDSNKAFIAPVYQKGIRSNKTGWTINIFDIPADSYPKGAKYFEINLTTAKSGEDIPKGKIYYDDVLASGGTDTIQKVADVNIIPTTEDSWYVLGDTVRFISESPISDSITNIEGIITDTNGKIIDDISVTSSYFSSRGWKWTPKEPGFYKIRFYVVINGIYTLPVCTTVSRTDLTSEGVKFNTYERGVAVVSSQAAEITQRNPKMAFSYQTFDPDALRLADKIGFSTARIHSIPWGAQFTNEDAAIHIGPGQFKWTDFDADMKQIKKYGFKIVGNILYTPKWASPVKDDDISICTRKYSTYAPTDMAYLEEFLDALIARYGNDIDVWEIWNEPHLPGGSVFWNDTPEKFVELLRTAYTKIKSLQPNDQVWIGGLGARRYLSFYSEILRLGAYPYFDKLAMHGYDADPWNYNSIAESMNLEPKQWACTEGHYILVSAGAGDTNVFMSEKRTAFRLMNELLRQYKYDAQLITHFSIYDWNTPDVMAWGEDNGMNISSSGLFKRTDKLEPRLSAVVMHNFIQNIGNKTEFGNEYVFSTQQKGATLKCDNKDLLLVWCEAEENQQASNKIKSSLNTDSKIFDWEGKQYSKDSFMMEPYVVYYITSPNVNYLNTMPDSTDKVVFSEYEHSKQESSGPTSLGNTSRIFDKTTLAVAANVKWIENDYKWNGNKKPDNYSFKAAIGKCDDGLEFIIDVVDGDFQCTETNYSKNQDMIEIGIDTLGNGISADKMIFRILRNGSNDNVKIIKTQAPNFVGDIPNKWTKTNTDVVYKSVSVKRMGNTVRYLIHIDYSELYPYFKDSSDKLHISLVSYNYDNGKYNGYFSWGSGLAFNANKPVEYGIIDFSK